MGWITAAARTRPIEGLAARLVLAGVFLSAGVGKFADHAGYVERFERWSIGAPGAMVVVTGSLEVLAGVSLLVGLLPRLGALTVVGVMAGAIATAGRVDGGRDVWVPLIMIALAAIVLVRGAGPWSAQARLAGIRASRTRSEGARNTRCLTRVGAV